MKENYFTIKDNDSAFSKRLQRIKNISRIPFYLFIQLGFFYLKKLFRLTGSEKEKADNYYFLTLINCDAYSVKIDRLHYHFEKKGGPRFLARKGSSSDLEVFNQVWGRDEYERATSLVKQDPSATLYIIDAGANVGYTSLFFNQIFPDAKIISIEPDDANLDMFRKQIELNHILNIEIIKAGIWSHSCHLQVDRTFRDSREWSYKVTEAGFETGLKGMHLNDIISDHSIKQIGLLKVDIEGAEKKLFENEEATRAFLKKTQVIAIEIHDEEISRERVYSILEESHFSHKDYSDLTIGVQNESA